MDRTQEAIPRPDAIWLSPAGLGKEIAITAPIPQTMHFYLPTALFDRLKDEFNLTGAPAYSVRQDAGVGDDVIYQIGRSLLSEITDQTTGGRIYAETASLILAARLLQKYCDSGLGGRTLFSLARLDHVRLRRVHDYISANIERDITLADLAQVVCQSPFHFSRKFTLAMGISPHRYISRIRPENAMSELIRGKLSLTKIALNAQFSSQSSITRAFHRATGMTRTEFQRSRR